MEELKFKITKLSQEKRIDGDVIIDTICINDDTDIRIIVSNRLYNDRYFVKNKLINEYNRLIELKKSYDINIGDII